VGGAPGRELIVAGGRDAQAGELAALSAEFPGWQFRIRQTLDGASIEAVAADDAARPGVYAVITPDAGELRQDWAVAKAIPSDRRPPDRTPLRSAARRSVVARAGPGCGGGPRRIASVSSGTFDASVAHPARIYDYWLGRCFLSAHTGRAVQLRLPARPRRAAATVALCKVSQWATGASWPFTDGTRNCPPC
jgi:hypothetical protein